MKQLLNIAPLICATVGIFLLFFVLLSNRGIGRNKKLKTILALIIILFEHNIIDSYFFLNGYENSPFVGFSYLHYHLTGVLFLYFTYVLLKMEFKVKAWGIFLSIYTLLRIVTLVIIYSLHESSDAGIIELAELLEAIDYLLIVIFNAFMLLLAYKKANGFNFVVNFNKLEQLSYSWLKVLILSNVVLFIGIFINSIIIFSTNEYLPYFKIETLITGLFFFVLIYSAMRFPVFAISGDFLEFEQIEKTNPKYSQSPISEKQSEALFIKIKATIENQQAFLNFKYKLNDLAESLNTPLHHISRAINENADKSFSDFINEYRINKAKELLLSKENQSATIYAISLDVGFNSKTAFYTAFKKATGETPTQFKSKRCESALYSS